MPNIPLLALVALLLMPVQEARAAAATSDGAGSSDGRSSRQAPSLKLPETLEGAPPGQAPPLIPAASPPAVAAAEDTVVPFPFGGRDRLYRLYVPKSVNPEKRLPLVVVLHGAFGSAAKISKKSGFSALAERHGFIAAFPQGTSLARTWNSGHCCGRSYKQKVDDVGFLAAVIEDIGAGYPVDPNRIYMVGESNGGMMAYRYAAERTSELAAIGVVAGTIGGELPKGQGPWKIPKPRAPIAVIAIHGADDRRIPYDGSGGKTVSATESVQFFVRENPCAAKPQEAHLLFADKVLYAWWAGCALSSNVVLVTLDGFGHAWPNPKTARGLGTQGGRPFDAATVIWEFLKRERRWRKIDMTPAQPPKARSP